MSELKPCKRCKNGKPELQHYSLGPGECQWLDAYLGLFKADIDGLRDGFLMASQINKEYPDLYCSEPYVEEAEQQVQADSLDAHRLT